MRKDKHTEQTQASCKRRSKRKPAQLWGLQAGDTASCSSRRQKHPDAGLLSVRGGYKQIRSKEHGENLILHLLASLPGPPDTILHSPALPAPAPRGMDPGRPPGRRRAPRCQAPKFTALGMAGGQHAAPGAPTAGLGLVGAAEGMGLRGEMGLGDRGEMGLKERWGLKDEGGTGTEKGRWG